MFLVNKALTIKSVNENRRHEKANVVNKALSNKKESVNDNDSNKSSFPDSLLPGKDSVITSFISHEEAGPGFILNKNVSFVNKSLSMQKSDHVSNKPTSINNTSSKDFVLTSFISHKEAGPGLIRNTSAYDTNAFGHESTGNISSSDNSIEDQNSIDSIKDTIEDIIPSNHNENSILDVSTNLYSMENKLSASNDSSDLIVIHKPLSSRQTT